MSVHEINPTQAPPSQKFDNLECDCTKADKTRSGVTERACQLPGAPLVFGVVQCNDCKSLIAVGFGMVQPKQPDIIIPEARI